MKKILTLVDESFEDLELWYPVYRLREEGCQVDLAAKKAGLYHGKYGVPCQVDLTFDEIRADDYDGLLVQNRLTPELIAEDIEAVL